MEYFAFVEVVQSHGHFFGYFHDAHIVKRDLLLVKQLKQTTSRCKFSDQVVETVDVKTDSHVEHNVGVA